jgi:hypothetical protein
METAAVLRMATAITQLTLCQVSSEEIETATKLLEKACHKLRGIPEVPPQRINDLDNATRQLHQLSCILDSCTISASYEVSEAQKALLLLPRTEKGSSTSSEEHYAQLPDPTHFDELQEH